MKKQTLKIDSKTEQLITVRDFVSQAAYASGFNDEEVSKIALAVDEACTNVIKHAYQYDAKKKISITVGDSNGNFEVSIVDSGKQFDPKKIKQPDMKEYLSSYRRGGLGVYLMKSLMDKVEYDIEPGKRNQVRLIKQLPR
ncbi:MAG: ATP-binding protein [Bacteroidetes bacterium]|nr:ATP-binding protein [Bacteroidota bacterium]MCW5897404.1 ATP-binding protein [Bacteroidota bacterium]